MATWCLPDAKGDHIHAKGGRVYRKMRMDQVIIMLDPTPFSNAHFSGKGWDYIGGGEKIVHQHWWSKEIYKNKIPKKMRLHQVKSALSIFKMSFKKIPFR